MTEEITTDTKAVHHAEPGWPVLAVLTTATFWTVTAEMLPAGLLPSMRHDLDVSEGAIGSLVSAWAITIALVGIPLVRLTLRVPRTALLTVSLAATAPANLLTALAPDYPIALIGRILAATAHGLFWAVVVSYVASLVDPARLGRALSIVLAGPTLAGLIGLPVAAAVADHTGWRTVFAGISLALALTALSLWLVLPRHIDAPGAQEGTGSWDHSARDVALVAAAGGLVLVGHFAAFTYVTTLVTGLGGLEHSAIPAVLLALGVTGGFGVLSSGVAADLLPRSGIVAAAGLIASSLTLLRLGERSPAVFLTGIVVWGFAIGAFPPILQARVLRVSTSSFRPMAGSIVVTALNLGVAAGAILGGLALRTGPTTLIVAATTAAASGTLALALLERLHGRNSSRPAARRAMVGEEGFEPPTFRV